ncbi:hypothetical protein, partial [Burkholderia cenocepacia]|uniref:hypothetical protein n=3 Tax=Burkholderia cenocepacia TaxID=95486 RepID=UPI0022378360
MLAHAGRYDHRGDRLSGALLFKHGVRAMGRGRAPIKKRPGPLNCTPKVGLDPTFGVFFMTKYDERFRRRVVQAYLAGEAGTKTL